MKLYTIHYIYLVIQIFLLNYFLKVTYQIILRLQKNLYPAPLKILQVFLYLMLRKVYPTLTIQYTIQINIM